MGRWFEYGPIREEIFAYEGETIQSCDGCLKTIEEKDIVIIQPYIYEGKSLREIWHKVCWEEEDATARS
jgi:hypothetical protein